MNADVKMHPSSELLNQFVQGELPTGKNVVVSAHLELCKVCDAKAKELQALAVSSWVDPSSSAKSDPVHEDAYAQMIQAIVKSPQINDVPRSDLFEIDIEPLKRSIKVPKVLAKAATQGLTWKKIGGGISEAQLRLDNETMCEFIYMEAGSKVPVHTHMGSESTLVLDGTFEDDLGEYSPSDFIVRNAQHHHQPRSKEGCLCFAVLDSPLKFTEGLARLMNPVNRYRFNKALAAVAE